MAGVIDVGHRLGDAGAGGRWRVMTENVAASRTSPGAEELGSQVLVVWRSAFATASRAGEERDVAEDIAQTAVVRFLLGRNRIRCAPAWAAAIARNEPRDRRVRELRVVSRDLPDPPSENDRLAKVIREVSLRKALSEVRRQDAELVTGALEGRPHRELASRRAIPTSAVGAFLEPAVERVRRALG
jgi:DNA-directed RNA polymerase specialized sigma24 family protein